MTRAAQLLFLVGTFVAGNFPAAAESYCVACFGPDVVYRCVIQGMPEGAPPDPRHQIQCIKSLAKQGGHSRCSVERFSAEGCTGAIKVVDPNAAAEPPLVPPPTEAAPPAAPGAGKVPAPADVSRGAHTPPAEAAAPGAPESNSAPNGQPPRTVEELAKSTVQSTKKGLDTVTGTVKDTTEKAGEQIGGVGSAIGHAAKKSWHCLSSFFSDC